MCWKFTSRLKKLFCGSSLKISISQCGVRLRDYLVCVCDGVGSGGSGWCSCRSQVPVRCFGMCVLVVARLVGWKIYFHHKYKTQIYFTCWSRHHAHKYITMPIPPPHTHTHSEPPTATTHNTITHTRSAPGQTPNKLILFHIIKHPHLGIHLGASSWSMSFVNCKRCM